MRLRVGLLKSEGLIVPDPVMGVQPCRDWKYLLTCLHDPPPPPRPLCYSANVSRVVNLSNNLLSLPFLFCLFGSSLCCISRQRVLNY